MQLTYLKVLLSLTNAHIAEPLIFIVKRILIANLGSLFCS